MKGIHFWISDVVTPPNVYAYRLDACDLLTQFHLAEHDGVTGLLAHNYLSGSKFDALSLGQPVSVWYTDDHVEHFEVTSIHRFQKLQPARLNSDLLDLDSRAELTTAEVYARFYRGGHHVTFQTCLENEGRLDWGLLFVVASPSGK